MMTKTIGSLFLRTIITVASISVYIRAQEDGNQTVTEPTGSQPAKSLNVRLPPSITKIAKSEIIFKDGDRLELNCEAIGIPEPTYTWFKNGELLEIRDRVTLEPPDSGNVVISPAIGYTENGNYSCKASNKYGTAVSAKVTVKQAKIQYTSRTDPVGKTVNIGESLVLEPFDKIESFPEPLYNWKTVIDATTNEDQKGLITTPRIALNPANGKLYFAHVLQDDVQGGRIYKMDVYNAIEDVTRGGSPYIINAIDGPITNKKPTMLTPTNANYEVIGIKGKNATLKCFFGGFPTPTISWRQPSNPPPQSRIDCTQEHNTECLIRFLQYTDSGTYRCTGENVEGKKEVKFKLKVESIPSFATAPKNMNGTEGESVTFECIPDAKPGATIEWFTNGELIDPADPGTSKLIISRDRRTLTMRDICKNCEGDKRSDLQVFMCKLSNKHGEDSASAYLNVIEATTIYETSERLIELDPSTGEPLEANFTCKSRTDPLTKDELEQGWWHGNARLYDQHGPYIIENNEENLFVNLTDMSDEERRDYVGEYECRAYTQYSNAKVTFKLTIKGIKPRGTTVADIWWIFLLIFLIILLILLCICCCICLRRNRGDSYPVDEKEKKNGNDPEAELRDMDFHEHHRDNTYHDDFKGSKASLLQQQTESQHSLHRI